MAHVAIICRMPKQPEPDAKYPGIQCHLYPTLHDCMVLIDGKAATNIEEISWSVKQGEATRCSITFVGAVLHVEAPTCLTAEQIEEIEKSVSPHDRPTDTGTSEGSSSE